MKTKNKVIFALIYASTLLFSGCAGILNGICGFTDDIASSSYTMDIVAVKCNHSETYYSTAFYVLDATEADSFYLYSGNITSSGIIDATASTTVGYGYYSSSSFPLYFIGKTNNTGYKWNDYIKEPSTTTGYVGLFDQEYASKVYTYDDISTLQVKITDGSNADIFDSYSYTGTKPDGFYYSSATEKTYDSSYASYFTKITTGDELGTSFNNYLYAKYGDYYVRCFN